MAVSTAWINAWLAFTYAHKTSPDPGICNNDVLLMRDDVNKCWIPRPELVMDKGKRTGDYRRVSEATWREICSLYPGSGPSIKFTFKEVL
jgi:hypothetical protein